ncbi:transcription factor Tfb2 [Aulographum hederae CBS 113979]|uniref:RNA polymerase II transcription factor B subunit 2 n=1 Tax=Aulographum hederae CBS 113979 TaxID=1176131 RepID=A0A6G1H2M5_9PEZI|nr:transcription factor Tfb2 [Aulographum hederae CBS 113979]
MAMLYAPFPLSDRDLLTWIQPGSRVQKDAAIDTLKRLHIIKINPDPRTYNLRKNFEISLRRALSGGGRHNSFGVPCTVPKHAQLSVPDLDAWARGQWEAILYFMVGSFAIQGTSSAVPSDTTRKVKDMLVEGLLVDARNSKITTAGFDFLLRETNVQVWSLLVIHLISRKNSGADVVEMLSFIFMLGSMDLGRAYSTSPLSESQLSLLSDLHDYGLVKHSPPTAASAFPATPGYFYPTRLATTLSSDTSALPADPTTSTDSAGKGYIILETNYRLYAYTSSPLLISILALFTHLHTRFPNLVSGKLTKSSITSALALGISSSQILRYLSVHAHPQMLSRSHNAASANLAVRSILPPTVMDQVSLWEVERERVQGNAGYLIKDFDKESEYEQVCQYAQDLNVLVKKWDAKRMLFVTQINQVGDFMKRLKNKRVEKGKKAGGVAG